MDPEIEITKAVVEALNAETYSMPFEAGRAYDLTAELNDDGVLHVDVGIRKMDGEIGTRATSADDIEVDIVVRKKCEVDDIGQLDALMALINEIKRSFFPKRLSTETLGQAWCGEYARKPAFFQSHLRQFRQFTAPLTLTFSVDVPLDIEE